MNIVLKQILITITLSMGTIFTFAQGAGNCQKTTDPGAFAPGDEDCWQWVNVTTGTHFAYDGTSWQQISNAGGTGIDYVSNVTFGSDILTFTGIGNAFGSTVDISGVARTDEEITDLAGGMVSGNTESLITVTFQDADNTIDFAVEANLSNYTNDAGFLTSEVDGSTINELQTISWVAGTGGNDEITLSDGGGTITITDNVNDADADASNEGSLTVGAGTGTTSIISSNTSGSTDVTIAVTGAASISEVGNTITIGATDTDTQLSNEEVQDIAGGMASGNTETLIAVTYDDLGNSIDYVVEDDLSLYDNTTSGFLTAEVDGSVTNEGSLSVGAGTATTSLIQSNTSGSPDITLTAGTNFAISESGNNITLDATNNYFEVTSFDMNSSGEMVITETDENAATQTTIIGFTGTTVSNLAFDNRAAAEAALGVGKFWVASTTNDMGVAPGSLFVTVQ